MTVSPMLWQAEIINDLKKTLGNTSEADTKKLVPATPAADTSNNSIHIDG